MAQHIEINPDPQSLPLSLADRAMAMARGMQTSNTGTIRVPTGNGNDFIAGKGAQDGANWIDPEGVQHPIVDTSAIDKAAQDAQKAADAAAAKAEQTRQAAEAGVAEAKSDAAAATAKAEQVRADVETEMAGVRKDAADAAAKAEQVRTDTASAVQSVKSQAASAESKAQNASEKADKLAGSITDVTATVNGHSTQLKELSTKVEGAVSANGETVKSVTELKQTVTGLSATVSQNLKTATDALSKAASVEATANGLKTQVTQNSKTASDALSKATSVEQTANGITATLSKDYQTAKAADAKYSTKTELTATSQSLTSKITEAAKKGAAAMSKVTTLEQTANGLSAKVGETAKTLDATVQTVNQVKSTADSNKATISQVSTTANDALSRTSSLEQNLSGFKSEASQTYATKSDMGKQSSGSNLWCNQLFDPDKPQITRLVDNVTAPNGSRVNLLASRDHFNVATNFPVVPGHTYVMTAYAKPVKGNLSLRAGIWYTQQTSGNAYDGYVDAESTTPLDDGWMTATWRFTCPYGKSRGCVFFQIENWPPNNCSTQWLVANVTCTDVTGLQPAGDYATNSRLSQTADSIKASVAENARKADAAMSKASSVEQTASGLSTQITETARKADKATATANTAKSTADSNSQRITQTANTASSALSKATTVEQSLNGFKTSVQTSYQPWSMSDELVLNGLPDPSLPSWTSGDVPLRDGCYERTFPGGENHAAFSSYMRLAKPVLAGHRYLLSLEARVTSGTWADGDRFVFGLYDSWNEISVKGLTSAWRLYQGIANPDVGTGQAYLSSYAGSPGAKTVQMRRLSIREVTWEEETYASKTSLTQTADSIKASVAENARKADAAMSKASSVEQTASGLSTRISEVAKKGDQTVQSLNTLSADVTGFKQTVQQTYATGARVSQLESSLDGFRSTVSSTYATKAGVTQEISSKITQNNNSLDVRFATKTETKTAQDTANTASSHASDAQSRVGSLESCIRMTSDGVRVGRIVNGGFQGYSALVSPHGSFDVLDESGRTAATFQASVIDLLNGLVRLRNANNTGELLIKAPDGTYGYLSYNSDGMFLKSPDGTIRLEPKPGCNVYTRSKAIQPSQAGICNKATDANGIISVDNLSPPDGNANNGILSVTVTPINIGQDPTLLAFTPVIWAKGVNGFQVRLKTNNNTWVSGAQPYAFCWHVVWA